MRYITHKRYKGPDMTAAPVNLKRGTAAHVERHGELEVIVADNRPICLTSSQVAFDYFGLDDDHHGMERGELTRGIMDRLSIKDDKHQQRWDALWDSTLANTLRRHDHEDYWVWGRSFFEAPIADLEYILNLIKEV